MRFVKPSRGIKTLTSVFYSSPSPFCPFKVSFLYHTIVAPTEELICSSLILLSHGFLSFWTPVRKQTFMFCPKLLPATGAVDVGSTSRSSNSLSVTKLSDGLRGCFCSCPSIPCTVSHSHKGTRALIIFKAFYFASVPEARLGKTKERMIRLEFHPPKMPCGWSQA